jgi:hypothetical protein
MRKFGNYPIRINYNLHTQLRSRPKEIQFHEAKQYKAERQLSIKTNTSSDANLENGMYQPEIEKYENDVYDCLVGIHHNPVGRMVLGLINRSTTVWIIPRSAGDMKQCNCAQTGPLNYEIPKDGSYATGAGFGDTVIRFVPELGDDTLIHELVHAYRYSNKKYNPIEIDVHDGKERGARSIEEFLAHEMENIYMSQDHRPLTMDYKWASVKDKKVIYDYLVANTEILQTLKLFLHHDPLVRRTAHCITADYNSFRDYKQLEASFLNSAGLTELPELGAIVTH